jgi:hypothetical protein
MWILAGPGSSGPACDDEPGQLSGEFWFPVTPERLWVTIEQFDLFASW